MGAGNSVYYSSKISKSEKSPNIGVFNVRGCSTNELKKGEIGKMTLKRRLDVYALSETKLKWRGDDRQVMFGEVWAEYRGWREGGRGKGSLRCVVKWKGVSSNLIWVRVKIERERWVFISTYGPGGERSEEEIEKFWCELSECAGRFGMNESVVVLGTLNAREGNEVIGGIVGQHGVPERNESGERLLEMREKRGG